MREQILKAAERKQYKAIHEAAAKMEPSAAKAFLQAIEQLKGKINLSDLEEALAAGRINDAVTLVNAQDLENLLRGKGMPRKSTVFTDQLVKAFEGGAIAAHGLLPKELQVNAAFNLLNPRAVQYVEQWTGRLITEVGVSTQQAVTEMVMKGFQEGLSPATQARYIRRMVGLTTKQFRAVDNFRLQLEQQRNIPYDEFGRAMAITPADQRRLSAPERAIVRRHMKEGNLNQKNIDKMVDRYHASLIHKRAKDIARTETLNGSNAGQHELWKQMLDDKLLSEDARRRWVVTPDDRLRPSHAAIPGMNPDGVKINERFNTPFGPVIGPHDGNSELINCRCAVSLSRL